MEASNLQPHVPTLGVSVEAVREQLLLLGHTIPDHVIKAFLDNGLPGKKLESLMHVFACHQRSLRALAVLQCPVLSSGARAVGLLLFDQCMTPQPFGACRSTVGY